MYSLFPLQGTDSECPVGQRCYADTCGTGSGPIAYHKYVGNVEPNFNWCGTTWLDAKDRCHKPCPTGYNSEYAAPFHVVNHSLPTVFQAHPLDSILSDYPQMWSRGREWPTRSLFCRYTGLWSQRWSDWQPDPIPSDQRPNYSCHATSSTCLLALALY